MQTMTSPGPLVRLAPRPREYNAREDQARKRQGVFRRLVHAMLEARRRKAERELALRLGLHGERLTDEIERRMTRHFMGRGNFVP